MKQKIAIVLISLLGLGAVGCQQQDEQTVQEERTEKAYSFVSSRVDDLLDDIEANDSQRTEINAAKDRVFDRMVSMRAEGREVKDVALEQWRSDSPDADKLHKLVDERVDAWRKAMHEAVDEAIAIHGTLTPEQREQIAVKIEERAAAAR